jgi:hypothetical protein
MCSLHRSLPWDGPYACDCGSAGIPCPQCNGVQGDGMPRMPKGFMATEISDELLVLQR